MHVAQVLIVWEIEQIRLLATDSDLAILGYFDHVSLRGALDDLKCQDAVQEVRLELVGAHLENHVLGNLHLLVDLDEGARGAACVPNEELIIAELDLSMESGNALV